MEATYLDHAATTPMRAEALEAMVDLLGAQHGNPSGAHRLARHSRQLLDDAREVIGRACGSDPGGVVFTGGGTEADNLAITGILADRGGMAVCPASEHHAVLHPVEASGGQVARVSPDGSVDLGHLAEIFQQASAERPVTIVSAMLVNNESGVIADLAAIAEVMAEHAASAVLHTDAVQAVQWLPLDKAAADADLLSISAHKFGGPLGVGALVVKNDITVAAQLLGGGQERERRPGTQNVPGIVAMAAAVAATVAEQSVANVRIAAQRDRLADGLLSAIDGVVETGRRADKIPGSCHLCIEGIESEALLFLLERDDLYASAASSCSSGAQEPSHVLAAMGVDRELAKGSLRLSLGIATTDADIDRALTIIPPAVERLRAFPS